MAHRIVFLLEDLCFGGTQRQTLQLALRLDRSRFEPVLLTLFHRTQKEKCYVSENAARKPGAAP